MRPGTLIGRSGRALIFLGLIGAVGVEQAVAAFVVAPNAQANARGVTSNSYPLFPEGDNQTSQRYQQVYGVSQFAAVGGPILITQIAFRAAISETRLPIRLPVRR